MLVQGLLWFSQETLPVQQLARHTLCSARPVQWSVSMPELRRSHTSSIPHMRQGVVPEALSRQPIMRSADGDFGQSMIDGASGRTRCRISACLPSAMWVSLSCRTLRTTAHVPAQREGSTSGKSVSEHCPLTVSRIATQAGTQPMEADAGLSQMTRGDILAHALHTCVR